MAIIGAGPIGSILGGYLSQGGQVVAFVDILQEHLDTIKQSGLSISGVAELKTKITETYRAVSELASFNPEIIFVCVKTPVTKLLLPHLKNLPSDFTIISFQNGLDAEKDFLEAFGKDRTLRVVINYAGNYLAPGQVKMSFFNKPNYIGGFSPRGEKQAQEIATTLTLTGLDTQFVPDIRKYVWEKIILNAALSPLCAITGLTMKQAMDLPQTAHLVEEILKEGMAVAKVIGYDYGTDFFNHCIKYLKDAGHHKTSMHIDIENSRPTEIDYINGKIVEYGQANKVAIPYNETITYIIKGLESRLLKKT